MKYLSTTLSIGMCSCDEETQLNIEPLSEEQFCIEAMNAHSLIRGKEAEKMGLTPNEENITLTKGDTLYVVTERKYNIKSLWDTFKGKPTRHFYKIEVGYI